MVVKVRWEDAASYRNGDSDKTVVGECTQTTVGVISDKTDVSKNGNRFIRVFQNWDNWGSQDWTEIPEAWIIKTEKIGLLPQ